MDDTTNKYCNFKTTDCTVPSTKDLYKGLNFPKRFECPCKLDKVCKSQLTYFMKQLSIISDAFSGYGMQREQKNCIYKTTSSDYGYFTPTQHSVPSRYKPFMYKHFFFVSKLCMFAFPASIH